MLYFGYFLVEKFANVNAAQSDIITYPCNYTPDSLTLNVFGWNNNNNNDNNNDTQQHNINYGIPIFGPYYNNNPHNSRRVKSKSIYRNNIRIRRSVYNLFRRNFREQYYTNEFLKKDRFTFRPVQNIKRIYIYAPGQTML